VRAVLAAGGTAGHLFPALALARAVRGRDARGRVLFIVGRRGALLRSSLEREGWEYATVAASGLAGQGLAGAAAALARLPLGAAQAARILRRFGAEVVVGMGGYVAAPAILGAAAAGVPRLLHEQNAMPGLANRLLGPLVRRVGLGFAEAAGYFRPGQVVLTGNPVRPELLEAARPAPARRAKARQAFGLAPERFTALLFGGSQGAGRLNVATLEALARLAPLGQRMQFIHATGERDRARLEAGYRHHGLAAAVEAFLADMASAYAAADVVVCRAGASTLAELCALGKPALLVPYPHAANDHQRRNAEGLVADGAARMILDRDLDGARLAAFLEAAVGGEVPLAAIGERARARARPDAAERLADLVWEVAERRC
jgi:UDP-N-acetylglucosamine--N-acetylmuramyl-(pentapeptide) pyrophosphoryl-undecaprenol N-acetylglucosamine transferase